MCICNKTAPNQIMVMACLPKSITGSAGLQTSVVCLNNQSAPFIPLFHQVMSGNRVPLPFIPLFHQEMSRDREDISLLRKICYLISDWRKNKLPSLPPKSIHIDKIRNHKIHKKQWANTPTDPAEMLSKFILFLGLRLERCYAQYIHLFSINKSFV